MRWFKHLSRSHLDERLSALVDECGIEGYGFYWLLLEIVAESMDGSDKCSVTHSLPQWSRLLYSHHNRVGKYFSKLRVAGLIETDELDGRIRVTIPKLLKYRDEYSKKSGQPTDDDRDQLGTKNQKESSLSDGKKEQPENVARFPQSTEAKAPIRLPVQVASPQALIPDDFGFPEWFDRVFSRHPVAKRKDRRIAEQYIIDHVARGLIADLHEFEKCHETWCKSENWQWKGGVTAPTLAQWVDDQGYKYPPPTPAMESQRTGTDDRPLIDGREFLRRNDEAARARGWKPDGE